jgi:hypothetical protein
MKPHKHAALIHAWADGAEIEFLTEGGIWLEACNPNWNEFTVYRLRDPYAELKAAAKDPTKQIRLNGRGWMDAGESKWIWSNPVDHYEIRDKHDPYRELKEAAADPTKIVWDYVADVEHVGDFSGHIPACHYEIRNKHDPYAELKAAS